MSGPAKYIKKPMPLSTHEVDAINWDGSNVLEVVSFAPTRLSFGSPTSSTGQPQLLYSGLGITSEVVPVGSWIYRTEGGDTSHCGPHEFLSQYVKKDSIVDLDADTLAQIKKAVEESTWIPSEYMTNDWLSDVCKFLREGPVAFTARDTDVYLKTGFTLEVGEVYLVRGDRRWYVGITFDTKNGIRYMFQYSGDSRSDCVYLPREELESVVRRIARAPIARSSLTVHSNRTEKAGTIIGNEQWYIEGRPEDDTLVDIRYEDQTVIRGVSMRDVSWKSRPQSLGVHKTVNRVKWWRYSDV